MAKPLVSSLELPSGDPEYKTDQKKKWIDALTAVNCFVGPNNSGKSMLLRKLFATFGASRKSVPYEVSRTDVMSRFTNFVKAVKWDERRANEGSLIKHFQSDPTTLSDSWYFESAVVIENCLQIVQTSFQQSLRLHQPRDIDKTSREFYQFCNTLKSEWPSEPPKIFSTFIPAVRSARQGEQIELLNLARLYFDPNSLGVQQRFGQHNVVRSIWTGQDLFKSIRDHLLGTHSQRQSVRDFENFLTQRFFDQLQVTLVPRDGSDLVIKVGSEYEKPISNMGDGIQQVILMTWPIFEHRKTPLALFIEEPELYLHPGMQQKLMDVFLSGIHENQQLQVFLATHSHVFLDRTFDSKQVSILRSEKNLPASGEERVPTFSVRRLADADFSILRDLGVQNSSLFLANCTIWIEGVSDRIYIRRWLRLWQENRPKNSHQLAEDIHYAFLEYSGACITHWSFLDPVASASPQGGPDEARRLNAKHLCGELFLIADSDGVKQGAKYERLKLFEQKLGGNFHVHTSREIENLLSPEILLATVRSMAGTPTVDPTTIKQADYAQAKIAKYIEETILGSKGSKKFTESNSDALANKHGFALASIAHMKTWDDLSDEAKELTKKIAAFIESKNRK